MTMDLGEILFVLFVTGIFALGIGVIVFIVEDELYKVPAAADKANTQCSILGFDQHKSFERIGVWSTEPVAIKCEYAEKYTDLGGRVK